MHGLGACRIDLSDRKTISKMREIIKQAQEVPGPGIYDIDVDSMLARQRRIVDRTFSLQARKIAQHKNAAHQASAASSAAEKRKTVPEYSTVRDAIERFSKDLASHPSSVTLPEPNMLSGEILECGAAKRVYEEMLRGSRNDLKKATL